MLTSSVNCQGMEGSLSAIPGQWWKKECKLVIIAYQLDLFFTLRRKSDEKNNNSIN